MAARKALIDKIAALSFERQAEVEDFVDFLLQRDLGRTPSRAGAKAGSPVFVDVVENPDDAFDFG